MFCTRCTDETYYILSVDTAAPNYCGKCHLDCKRCEGPSQSDCVSCTAPNKYFIAEKRCYGSCPADRSTLNANNYNCDQISCTATLYGCTLCTSNPNYCLGCGNGQYLKETKCEADCTEPGFYEAEVEEAGKPVLHCLPCPANCQVCSSSQICRPAAQDSPLMKHSPAFRAFLLALAASLGLLQGAPHAI